LLQLYVSICILQSSLSHWCTGEISPQEPASICGLTPFLSKPEGLLDLGGQDKQWRKLKEREGKRGPGVFGKLLLTKSAYPLVAGFRLSPGDVTQISQVTWSRLSKPVKKIFVKGMAQLFD